LLVGVDGVDGVTTIYRVSTGVRTLYLVGVSSTAVDKLGELSTDFPAVAAGENNIRRRLSWVSRE
jgi:hypothetical protein